MATDRDNFGAAFEWLHERRPDDAAVLIGNTKEWLVVSHDRSWLERLRLTVSRTDLAPRSVAISNGLRALLAGGYGREPAEVAVDAAERAHQNLEAIDDPRERVRTLTNTALGFRESDPELAATISDQAVAEADALGDDAELAWALSDLIFVRHEHHPETERLRSMLLELVDRLGSRWTNVHPLVDDALAAHQVGDHDRSLQRLQVAEEMLAASSRGGLMSEDAQVWTTWSVLIRAELGDTATAILMAEDALADSSDKESDRVSQPVRYIWAGTDAGRSLGRGQIGVRVGDRSRGCLAIPQLCDRGARRRRARHRGWQSERRLFSTASDRHRQPPSLGAGPRPRRIGVGGIRNGGSRCGRRARQAGRRASTVERFRAPRRADRTSRRDPASNCRNSCVSRRQVRTGVRCGEPLEGLSMSASDLTIATDPDALGQYLLAQHESSRSSDDPAASDEPEIHRDPDEPEIHRDPDEPEIHRDPDEPEIHHDPDEPEIHRDPDEPEIHRDPDEPEIHRDPDEPEIHRDPDEPEIHRGP